MPTQDPVQAWGRGEVTVIDACDVAWINGAEAFAALAPAFRENLGDPVQVE